MTRPVAIPALPDLVRVDDWPQVLTRALEGKPPVEMSLVKYDLQTHGLSRTELQAAGLTWTLPAEVPAEQAWPMAQSMAQALHVLTRATRRVGASSPSHEERLASKSRDFSVANTFERRFLEAIANREGFQCIESTHTELVWRHEEAHMEPRWGLLCFGRRHWGWATSHEQGYVATTVLHVPISLMPFQLSEAAELCRALLTIAGDGVFYPPSRTGTCRFCKQTFDGIDLHDDTCCHSCAETHLGVIH